jgi:alkylated DNA repair dioxygenase AlkB
VSPPPPAASPYLLESVFVVLPGAVSVERQQELVAGIMGAQEESGTTQGYRYGFDKLAAVLVGREHRYASWDEVPGRLAQDSERLVAQAREVCAEVPEHYDVAAIELLGYRPGSSLTPHVDCVPGWSVIITLGATARFYFNVGARDKPQHVVALRSGDAILFPTSHAAAVWHGIEGFEAGSEPDWFSAAPYCRLCLQFRASYYHLH